MSRTRHYLQDYIGYYYRLAQQLSMYGYDKEIIDAFLEAMGKDMYYLSSHCEQKLLGDTLMLWKKQLDKPSESTEDNFRLAEKCLDQYYDLFFKYS